MKILRAILAVAFVLASTANAVTQTPPAAQPPPDSSKPAAKPKTSPTPSAKKPATTPQPASPAASATPAPDDPNADLVYGAYQRGFYKTAFDLATKRAQENSDPKAMSMLGELYA